MVEALLSISLASRGQLVNMLLTIEPHNKLLYLDQILHALLFLHCQATGMQNVDGSAERI